MDQAMFKPFNRDQEFLLPHSMRDLIPPDDLSIFIAKAVELLDLTPLLDKYHRLGQNSYYPGMMLALLFYAYCKGIFSSRKIAESLRYDVRFMYLAGMQRPDFRTISDFRKDNLELLQKYFVDIVRLCIELGMVPFNHIAIDGTQIGASASRKRMKGRREIARYLADVEDEIVQLLTHAQSVDQEEDQQLQNLQQQRDKLQAAKTKLDGDPKQQKANLTDPDCRMQKKVGPGYNSQIAVDADSLVILSAKVVPDANDSQQLIPMIDEVEKVAKSKANPKKVLADSGYACADAFRQLKSRSQVDAYVPTPAQVHHQRNGVSDFNKRNFNYDLEARTCRCPQGEPMRVLRTGTNKSGEPYVNFIGTACPTCPCKSQCTKAEYRNVVVLLADDLLKKMEAKMETPAGYQASLLRKQSVEPVFGNLKEQMGFRRFRLRGLHKVNGEFSLLCGAFNLKKLHRFLNDLRLAEVSSAIRTNTRKEVAYLLKIIVSWSKALRKTAFVISLT